MSKIRTAGLTTLAGAAGAAAAYILDPERGDARRTQARDQLLSRARYARRDLDKNARRGEVETQEQIDMLVRSADHVDGVEEVRNLLHLPGEPAPTT